MKKKILIVSRSFYPQNSPRSFRTTELAKEFARQGHEVTVLTPRNQEVHPAFEKEHNFYIKDLGQPTWKSPDFGKSKIGYFFTRAAYRFLSLVFEYPNIELMFLVNKALKKENGYDLLISIAVPYPVHWGVAWARNKKHPIAKLWVADCGDPYMKAKLDTFSKAFYFKFFEQWFSRKADLISITKESFKVNYFEEFHEKIVEIPQGFCFEDVRLADQPIKNKVPHFAYAGTFIKEGRDPSMFLEHLTTLDLDFRFILYTKSRSLLEPFLKKLNGKIEIRDYIPRNLLIYELSQMDFLVNFEYDPLVQSPSKLIDYGLTGRPILNIVSAEFKPEVVFEFLSGNYKNKFSIPDFEKYRIENVCTKFLSLGKNGK